jgi:hypothetical protein
MNPDALAEALSRLAVRNYGEEGIPMLLILENTAREALHGPRGAQNASRLTELEDPTEQLAQATGLAFRIAVTSLHGVGRELTTGDLARVIEWVADEGFGPEALAEGRGDAQV